VLLTKQTPLSALRGLGNGGSAPVTEINGHARDYLGSPRFRILFVVQRDGGEHDGLLLRLSTTSAGRIQLALLRTPRASSRARR